MLLLFQTTHQKAVPIVFAVSFDKDLMTVISQATFQTIGDCFGPFLIPGTITYSQGVNEILCYKPWWPMFKELLYSAFLEGNCGSGGNHKVMCIITLKNLIPLLWPASLNS